MILIGKKSLPAGRAVSFEFLKLDVSVNGEDVSPVGFERGDLVADWASGLCGVVGDNFIHVPLLDLDL